MYPNLYYAFKDLFGVQWKPLRFVHSFGFFVAIAFILAAVVLVSELRRKSKLKLLQSTEMKITVGKPATAAELILNFLLGFLFGYKIIALFIMNNAATENPQDFILSPLGSWPAGLLLGALAAGLKWREKNKQKLDKPESRIVRIWPQDRVGEMTIIALVFGLAGAKLFDIFENWDAFTQNPMGTIFSASGLTFYGGLICAALAIWWYARRHKIAFWHLNDAAAPALMIAYAVGRIGCQVAGDGDWGIHNSAYITNEQHKVVLATPTEYAAAVDSNAYFLAKDGEDPSQLRTAHFKKPASLGFLPNWMFAYNYPHNVNNVGKPMADCEGDHCAELPLPVFPTPFYETVMCLALFGLLWAVRKRMKVPGTLFALYLVVNGLERFFIEKIRVNTTLKLFGHYPTQAEVISTLLVLFGLGLWIFLVKRSKSQKST